MTDLESEYQRLAELNSRRTPGLWDADDYVITGNGSHIAQVTQTDDFPCLEPEDVADCEANCEANQHFIASAMFELLTRMREEIARLRAVLQGLHDHEAEYIKINNLGDPWHNQVMKNARDALDAARKGDA